MKIKNVLSFHISYTWISIGLRFGMMQARIGLVTLLHNFEFLLGSEMTVPIPINLKIALLTPEYLHLQVLPLSP